MREEMGRIRRWHFVVVQAACEFAAGDSFDIVCCGLRTGVKPGIWLSSGGPNMLLMVAYGCGENATACVMLRKKSMISKHTHENVTIKCYRQCRASRARLV